MKVHANAALGPAGSEYGRLQGFGNFGAEVPEIAKTGLIRLKGSITGP
jgi:hypothetical protein